MIHQMPRHLDNTMPIRIRLHHGHDGRRAHMRTDRVIILRNGTEADLDVGWADGVGWVQVVNSRLAQDRFQLR